MASCLNSGPEIEWEMAERDGEEEVVRFSFFSANVSVASDRFMFVWKRLYCAPLLRGQVVKSEDVKSEVGLKSLAWTPQESDNKGVKLEGPVWRI